KSTPGTPETETMAAIPDTGELDRTPLPRLLLELSAARFDGCLHLRRDRIEKSFRFQRGAPISAESSLASETLGLWLLDKAPIAPSRVNRRARGFSTRPGSGGGTHAGWGATSRSERKRKASPCPSSACSSQRACPSR